MTSNDIKHAAQIRKERYEKSKEIKPNNLKNGTAGSDIIKTNNASITGNHGVIHTLNSLKKQPDNKQELKIDSSNYWKDHPNSSSASHNDEQINPLTSINKQGQKTLSSKYKKYQKLELALNIINALAVCGFAITAFFVNFPLVSAAFIATYFLTRILVKMAYTAKNLDKIDHDNSLSIQKNASKSKSFLFFAISLIPEMILATIYCLAFIGILPLGIVNILTASIILPMFLLPLIIAPIMSKICGKTIESSIEFQNISWSEESNTNKLISGIFNNQVVHMVYYLQDKFDRVENFFNKTAETLNKSSSEQNKITGFTYNGNIDDTIEPMSKDSQQVLAHTYCPSLLESITDVFEFEKNAISK